MLVRLMESVEEFHEAMEISPKHKFPTEALTNVKSPLHNQLHYAALQMKTASLLCEEELRQVDCDPRLLRLHLILEECGELTTSMLRGDAVETLDAFGDLMYVVAGSAVQFDWDLAEAMIRIHDSNMTKQPKTGPRLRDKGDSFVPVNLEDLV